MSYLGYPRLHFSGQFQAAPSTVNNDPVHFDSAIFTPNNQLPQKTTNPISNGWWNPDGHAYWRLRETKVTSVVYKDGSTANTRKEDPVIGKSIFDGDETVPGKIVDLDSEQQMVSEIWGWSIKIGSPSSPEQMQKQVVNGLKASYRVAPFSDIWVRYPEGGPDSFYGAAYQSILESVELLGNEDFSRFFNELKDEKGHFPKELSIKFNVYGFNDDRGTPDFTWGKITGAIGPYDPSEPKHFVNARYLRPVKSGRGPAPGQNAVVNYVPARIDEEKATLFVDLGNSLLTSSAGGTTRDIGNLEIGVLKGETFHSIGNIPYRAETFMTEQAGIAEFPLSKQLMKLASQNPLAIKGYNVLDNPTANSGQSLPKSPVILVQENEAGAFLRADQFVFRMDANSEANVDLYASKFGQPASDVEVSLSFNNNLMKGQQRAAPNSPYVGPRVGTPESAVKFPPKIKTGKDGKATFPLSAKDPGNPRQYIDGQVYGVQYTWDNIKNYNANPTNVLSLLVFDGYQLDGKATWIRDVQPILSQYANLYPVMKKILDLNSYHNVVDRKGVMSMVFSRPVTDPNYMPVTRDLSGDKKKMLLDWLAQKPNPSYIEIKTKKDLQQALQIAIELEHSTLPPYLTAYWSIIPGHNNEVSQIIRSVIMEEMLHMSLACNLLNAIGGSPQISVPGFIPIYPTGLPGSLAPGLTVNLRKCSIDQIRDVFMAIENPKESEIPDEKDSNIPDPDQLDHHKMTIGWFYKIIKDGFKHLHKELKGDLFTGDPSRQLKGWHGPGDLFKVHDLQSALHAIDEIVEQGEGFSAYNPEDGYDELAHYYKFSEIVEGRKIVVNNQKNGYTYTGAPIPFDPAGVFPMVDNPGLHEYSDKSEAKIKSEMFNKSYTNLLHSLHQVFNGNPDDLTKAIGIMFSLTVQARDLMNTPVEPGSHHMAGPAFRYYPINYYS